MTLYWYTGGYKRSRRFAQYNYEQVSTIDRGLLPESAIWWIE
ncbi:hypothetical protein VmeM32_00170 [Vibrio phage vB_VmeM-32]|nr:hypothetical protein VmeM32_00170 [Vibrio phage vB_VmeM-32]